MSTTQLIKSDGEVNSNKFWRAINLGNSCLCEWGRVGTTGQSKTFNFSSPEETQRYIDKKVREKTKEGYSLLQTIAAGKPTSVDVKSTARREIKSDPESLKLIDELVAWNVHNITLNSSLTVTSNGVQLPSGLGILSAAAIQEARGLLKEIISGPAQAKRDAAAKKKVEKYLMLCPQVVDRSRGWIDSFLTSKSEFDAQESLLDSLEAAVSTAQVTTNGKPTFETELSLLDKGTELDRVTALFNASRQSVHDAYRFKMGRVFSVRVGPQALAYNGCSIGNEKELWHGSSIGNLLSIIKCGLIIPVHASNGSMFGRGIYMSDQATKALNYAGGFWSGQRARRCFMFLCKAKMGREYTPSYPDSSLPRHGYDSTFAKANLSGVINNEMICYNTSQVLLTHLCEFNE